MKRFTLVFLIAILSISCSDTVTRDEVIFQTMIDNDFFRSQTGVAYLNDEGHLTIESTTNESIKLTTEFNQTGIFTLEPEGVNSATYKTYLGDVYTSKHSNVDGFIEILQINEDGYDGKFNFNAVNETGDTIVFHKGAFFNVQLGVSGSGDIEGPGDIPPPPQPSLYEYMKAHYLTEDVAALPYIFDASDLSRTQTDDGKILITGYDEMTTMAINISYNQDLEPGSYTMAEEPSLMMTYGRDNPINATSGELTINAVDNDFYTGEFSFYIEYPSSDNAEVTLGEFAVQ